MLTIQAAPFEGLLEGWAMLTVIYLQAFSLSGFWAHFVKCMRISCFSEINLLFLTDNSAIFTTKFRVPHTLTPPRNSEPRPTSRPAPHPSAHAHGLPAGPAPAGVRK